MQKANETLKQNKQGAAWHAAKNKIKIKQFRVNKFQ